MTTSHPLLTMARLPLPFADEVRKRPGTDDPFTLCAAASAARTLSVLDQVQLRWDDPTVGLLLPCLRPACEDLIALEYLRGIPGERNIILRALMSESTAESIEAQTAFFESERSWQPILKELPVMKNVEPISSIGSRLGWPKRNNGYPFPTTYWMAQKVNLVPLYKFIYKMTSNIVHFNPQTLLRFCWGNEDEMRVGVDEFHIYYRDSLAVYGCYLYGLLTISMKDVLGVSADHVDAVTLMTTTLNAQPRWPEMVTFEECDLMMPDHIAPWREFMQNHPDEEIRKVFQK